MAAALMSCMAAALNSCATLISMDIVKRLRPATPDERVVTIGRITTGVIMVLAMLWSTQGDQFGTIFEAINKIPMTFAPAVTTVFVLGVMWKRGTKQAAMATLYVGSIIGVIYFLLDMPGVGKNALARHRRTQGLADWSPTRRRASGIPFMLVGPIIAALCVVIYIVTSLLTPAMDPAGSRQGLLGSSAGVPQRPAGGLERPADRDAHPADRGGRPVLHSEIAVMQYNPLGKTGLNVSRLSFGASALGGVFRPVDEAEAIRRRPHRAGLGINYFDVAPAYGGTRSETVLGKALQRRPARPLLSCPPRSASTPARRSYGDDTLDYSRAAHPRVAGRKRGRLGTDYFDIIHIHDIEYQGRRHTEWALAEGLGRRRRN